MSVVYEFGDIEDTLDVAGFVRVKNNGGSHLMYKNPITGISQPVPYHDKTLKSKTAESILSFIILSSLIQKIDLTDPKYKLNRI